MTRIYQTGRKFEIDVIGDDAREIELIALHEAEQFFGLGTRLEVVQDYTVRLSVSCRYVATVTVREPL
jgi:hypothetical protein